MPWEKYAQSSPPPATATQGPWSRYAKPAATADQEHSAASPIPPPSIAKPTVAMHPSFLIGDPDADATPQSLGDVAKGMARNLYQVSAPGIASSIAHRDSPGSLSQVPVIGAAMESNAAPLHRLPQQITETGALMMIPEVMESGVEDAPQTVAREAAPPSPRVARPSDSTPGVLGRAGEVALRRAGGIPGVQATKDALYILRGKGEKPTIPEPQSAPVPETNGIPWGTGGKGPIDLRGKMIPEEERGVSASATPDATGENKPFAGGPDEPPPPKIAKPHDATGKEFPAFAGGMDEAQTPKPIAKPGSAGSMVRSIEAPETTPATGPMGEPEKVPTPAIPSPSAAGDPLLERLRGYAARIEREGHGQEIRDADDTDDTGAANLNEENLNDPKKSLAAWKKNLAFLRSKGAAKPSATQ